MPELGRTLSQARVARGLTLEDCERDTRISKRYIDALEREEWKIFPAPVYSRAFLRTYAQYLGLNPAELMRLFQMQTEEPEFKPLPEIAPPSVTGSMNYLLAGGVLVLLLIAGVFIYFSIGSGGGSTTPTTAKTAPTVVTESRGGGVQNPASGKPIGEVKKGTVPDLAGARVDDAITALQQAGLNYVIVETSTAKGQSGIVSSQDPAAGAKSGGSGSVTLVVPGG